MKNLEFLATLNQYKEEGKLYSQVHPTLPLTIWNYTPEVQYEGLWDDITLMCRGLVTDDTGRIWARPFKKFFNLEENRHEPTQDFEITEKLDGSLIIVFWYNEKFIVASRGSFTSEHALKAREILDQKYSYFQSLSAKDETYCFELIGFEQIVVSYPEIDLILTGVMKYAFESHRDSSMERWKNLSKMGKIKIVKFYSGLDWKTIKDLNWKNSEGFVVRFSNGSRCKIKFEDYIRLHGVMTNISEKRILRSLVSGEPITEILDEVPDEFFNEIQQIEKGFHDQFSEIFNISKLYFEYYNPLFQNSRKRFQSRLQDNPYTHIIFKIADNQDPSDDIWRMITRNRQRKNRA